MLSDVRKKCDLARERRTSKCAYKTDNHHLLRYLHCGKVVMGGEDSLRLIIGFERKILFISRGSLIRIIVGVLLNLKMSISFEVAHSHVAVNGGLGLGLDPG